MIDGDDVLDLGRDRRELPRWLLAPFAAAIVVAGYFAATQHGHSSGKPAAVTSIGSGVSELTTPAPEPTLTGDGFAPPVTGCEADTCATSDGVPPAVVEALREYVPSAGRPRVLTFFGSAGDNALQIEQRTVESVFGSVDLLVRITPYRLPQRSSPLAIKATPPGLASAFLSVEGAAYVVDLEWIGPETQPPPIAALNKLIRDTRLEE